MIHNIKIDKKSSDTGNEYELEFDVMPDRMKSGGKSAIDGNNADPAFRNRKNETVNRNFGTNGRRVRISLIFIVVLIILIATGFWFYQRYFPDTFIDRLVGNHEKIRYESDLVEDTLDSDNDGLVDIREDSLQTDKYKPDSDDDGLADGDEVNIYTTNPLNPDSDGDGYGDGKEVSSGYNPVVSSSDPATDQDLALWNERIEEFSLHEPSLTLINTKKPLKNTGQPVLYINQIYKYQVLIPSRLIFREFNNGQQVGLYANDSDPTDDNVLHDPISFSLAIKMSDQSLSDWISAQYKQSDDYGTSENVLINDLQAIRLNGMTDTTCPSDRIFLPNKNQIIVITLSCYDSGDYRDLFNEMIKSFKFTD